MRVIVITALHVVFARANFCHLSRTYPHHICIRPFFDPVKCEAVDFIIILTLISDPIVSVCRIVYQDIEWYHTIYMWISFHLARDIVVYLLLCTQS